MEDWLTKKDQEVVAGYFPEHVVILHMALITLVEQTGFFRAYCPRGSQSARWKLQRLFRHRLQDACKITSATYHWPKQLMRPALLPEVEK